jgi:hypothetical protein
MNWLLKIIFPNMDRTVRISRDYLPGLKPPTIAPFTPKRKPPEREKGPDYEALYEQYLRSPASKKKPEKKKKGFDA